MDQATSQESGSEKIKICFVGLYAYSLFNQTTRHRFGGAEVDAWQVSTQLSKLPWYEVSFVVFDHQQPSVEHYGGVTVYAHSGYRSSPATPTAMERLIIRAGSVARISGVLARCLLTLAARYRTWPAVVKWMLGLSDPNSLWIRDHLIEPEKCAIYKEINADIYCVFGADSLAAEVAAYCRHAGKKLILFVVSEVNLSQDYTPDSKAIDYYHNPAHLCHYAIMQADLIITQTTTQAHLLQSRFGKGSITIYNSIDLTPEVQNPTPYQDRKIALWVGKSDNIKRPQILLQLAAEFPDVEFVLVMNRAEQQVYGQVLRSKKPNVTVHEHVPFHEIERIFANSFVLINTSICEGFPNAFLQAGKYGVPILSFVVDPDSFIETYECGVVAHGDFDGLVEGMRLIQADQQGPQRFSRNIKQYVAANHSLDDKVPQLDRAIRDQFVRC
jgi:glycosyltransferase involved in cell wall biosynthesis